MKNKLDLNQLIKTEEEQIKKLHDLVSEAINEQQLISAKLIDVEDEKCITFGQKLSDKIANFGGSWTFIIVFLAVMGLWISLNIFNIFAKAFDPYPFILLNLILSCIAALQAPVIMMSQKRQEEKDRTRAMNDYMINIKAEMEVQNLHRKVDLLIADQMKYLFEIQHRQLEMLQRLEKHFNEHKK